MCPITTCRLEDMHCRTRSHLLFVLSFGRFKGALENKNERLSVSCSSANGSTNVRSMPGVAVMEVISLVVSMVKRSLSNVLDRLLRLPLTTGALEDLEATKGLQMPSC